MPSGEKTWQVLKLKDTVHSGDLIQTGMERSSSVDIAAPPPLVPLDLYVGDATPAEEAPIPPNGWDRRLWSTPPRVVDPDLQRQEDQKRRRLLLRLYANSALKVEELSVGKSARATQETINVRLHLQAGHVLLQVTNSPETVDCQVRFTNCIAKIQGGNVAIGDGTLKIINGTAAVTQATGQVVEVPDGFLFRAETGMTERMPPQSYIH